MMKRFIKKINTELVLFILSCFTPPNILNDSNQYFVTEIHQNMNKF